MSKANPTYRVQVLERTFRILDVLAEDNSGVGLTGMAERLKLHKSTTHRLIMVLESNGFVEKNDTNGKYRLGSRLMQLGLSAVARLDVCEVAGPFLRMLVQQTGETAHLGVLRDGEVVSLINIESGQTLRTPSTVGTRTPAHCTSLGKAILAFSPEERLDDFLHGRTLKSYTPKTITSPARFKTELRAICKRGYSIDNEEREQGLRCIGAPVYDSSNNVIAAIGIAGPAFRITDRRLAVCSTAVVNIAGKISAALGRRLARSN